MSRQVFYPSYVQTGNCHEEKEGPLLKRNVKIDQHRTSIRLEPALWHALETIAVLERCTVNDICTEIGSYARGNGFTSAIRVYIVSYLMDLRRQHTERLYQVKEVAELPRKEALLPA